MRTLALPYAQLSMPSLGAPTVPSHFWILSYVVDAMFLFPWRRSVCVCLAVASPLNLSPFPEHT